MSGKKKRGHSFYPVGAISARSFYKGHCIIAFYEAPEDERLVCVIDNSEDLIGLADNEIKNTWSTLSHAFDGRGNGRVKVMGVLCYPHVIDAFGDSIGQSVMEFRAEWGYEFPSNTKTIFSVIGEKTPVKGLICKREYQNVKILKVRSSNGVLHLWVEKPESKKTGKCRSRSNRTSRHTGTRAGIMACLMEYSS